MTKKTILLIVSFCFIFLLFQNVAGTVIPLQTLNQNEFSPEIDKIEINSVSLNNGNYFVMTLSMKNAIGSISSISSILKSSSGKEIINIKLVELGNDWNASFKIPSSSEQGTWFIDKILLNDNSLNYKEYQKNEINKYFFVGTENSLDSLNQEVINEQSKQKCIQEGSDWNEETKTCICNITYFPWSECKEGIQIRTVKSTCPSIVPLLSQECVVVKSETNQENEVAKDVCTIEYSPWSECQSGGTRTREPKSLCDNVDPITEERCIYLTPEDLFNNTIKELNSSQKIVDYLNSSFKLISRNSNVAYTPQELFNKKEGDVQDFATFVAYSLKENGFNSSLINYDYIDGDQRKNNYVILNGIASDPRYIYFDSSGAHLDIYNWSLRNLCQKEEQRLNIEIIRYGIVIDQSKGLNPLSWINNRQEGQVKEEIELEVCTFEYSPWSECQTDGIRKREVTSYSPENCVGGIAIIEGKCKYIEPIIPCMFKYSPWSECHPNGTQTTQVVSKMPANCSSGEPILAKSCVYVGDKKEEGTEEKSEEVVAKESNISPASLEYNSTESNISIDLPKECLRAGIKEKEECDIYVYQLRIVPECLSLGISDKDQCRSYFLSNYDKPLKCERLSEVNCIKLIDDVILSTLKKAVSQEKRNELIEVSGKQAVISKKEDQSFVIKVESKEIKIENLPISANENTLVKLISIETNQFQQGLSPVGISFSSKGSFLSDDVFDRIGESFKAEELSGVDRAIVENKSLEQPKFLELSGDSIIIEDVKTIITEEKASLVVRGKALPNQVITLFIYSSMPIVVTVQADQDGNWVYSLDKSMVDGTHEVYAVLHNDEGRIVEASAPKTFFIAEAQAISMEEMLLLGDIFVIQDSPKSMMTVYLLGSTSLILILIALFLIIKRRNEEI